MADHGVGTATLDIDKARRRHGGAESVGLALLKAQFVVVIALALVERAAEPRMPADKERHVLGALVGHLVGDLNRGAIDGVARTDGERERVLLEELGVVGRRERKDRLGGAALLELPLLLARKAVARKVDLFARLRHRVVIAQAAANGKTNRRLSAPNGGVALPQILTAIGGDGGE